MLLEIGERAVQQLQLSGALALGGFRSDARLFQRLLLPAQRGEPLSLARELLLRLDEHRAERGIASDLL